MPPEDCFEDKILLCVDCHEEFVFTARAQEYFAGRGFTDEPKRCKSCYLKLRKGRRPKEGPEDDALGVGCPVFRWPPDGSPPKFLLGHANPPPDLNQGASPG